MIERRTFMRSLLVGVPALVAAPAIVRATSLMPVKPIVPVAPLAVPRIHTAFIEQYAVNFQRLAELKGRILRETLTAKPTFVRIA